ncbi:LUD domain-containing protein [Nocardia shimofusensis]|uniref:LUD domain-containing protein n=1 Tax=Nocardia shimofusensis TaxID=228596 RepID=UPI000832F9D7|nr:LUD domain-containing protein [Nocardia shimofusensis]
MSSDEHLLRRVRDLLIELPDDERMVPVSRAGRHALADPADRTRLVTQFLDRLARGGAHGVRTSEDEVPAALRELLSTAGVTCVLVPDGLPGTLLAPWAAEGNRVVVDSPMAAAGDLDGIGAVVTVCAGAVADSGALVFDGGPGQMRKTTRAESGVQVCLVRAEQVGPSLPEVVDRLDPRRAITLFGAPAGPEDEPAAAAGLIVLVVE